MSGYAELPSDMPWSGTDEVAFDEWQYASDGKALWTRRGCVGYVNAFWDWWEKVQPELPSLELH